MQLRFIAFFIAFAVTGTAQACGSSGLQLSAGQRSGTQVEAELSKLTPSLRDSAQAMLNQPDELRRAQLARQLANTDLNAVTDFLLAVLSSEPSARVRSAIVGSFGQGSNPRIREALGRIAASDADASVSLLALERLRLLLMVETRDLLVKRLELARQQGDEAGMARLAKEQERWISLVRGTMLPSFMRVPPPLFSLKPDSQPVRVLAFGDFGTGSGNQKQVAASMAEYHRKTPFDLGITLGDNFYDSGMASPTDSRWKLLWDEPYNPLGIKFYASLGNHDWGLNDSPAAEILYSERSPTWRMPSPYYTFTAGPAQFFALDTNEVSEAQLLWLDGELKKSTAKWRIVYGHHPIYSDGDHGDDQELIERLLPVLKNRVDAYLAGHDHVLNHIKPESGVQFFISGGGGQRLYRVKPGARSLFAQATNGFAVVEASADSLTVRFIGTDLKTLYEHNQRK
ncbi:MAG TPA: metallophosphoesterase [Blastocatellia bacterium]|nr:metallophosphoesterase [Blastocatellia bacterium]